MQKRKLNVMVFGIGAFTQGSMNILKKSGANVSCYLTRDYGHYGPSLEGDVYSFQLIPNPCQLVREKEIDFVIPMSINWNLADWTEEFLSQGVPIFSPIDEGMRIERDRDFTRKLCQRYRIPFPKAGIARNRLEAEVFLTKHPRAYVIKNTLCSPNSPIHTIVCETEQDTKRWLERINYAEGVFLQEYLGRREVGHIAVVSGGEIYSLVTNQEYKRAFNGDMGPVAGAPLGGLIERDENDKYSIARELLHPLLPWFREVDFHGPIQVTAIRRDHKWFVAEYNVRTGVTSGPMILQMLENPLEVLWGTVRNQKVNIRFKPDYQFGCCLTLAGWGYPYISIDGPNLPVQIRGELNCVLWWNEVAKDSQGKLYMTGHRIADVVAISDSLEGAIKKAYENISKIYCLSSYYRTDIGKSLWPPGSD